MRTAIACLVVLAAAGCDGSEPEAPLGTFAATLSGAQTGALDGQAAFLLAPCRTVTLRADDGAVTFYPGCRAAADSLRAGTVAIAPQLNDGTLFVTLHSTPGGEVYRGTAGTVEILDESAERITARFSFEARPVDADNQVVAGAEPVYVAGTFDARGFAGLD